MKTAIILFLGLFVLAATFQPEEQKYNAADKVFLERQKDILKLFKFVKQPSYFSEYAAIPHNYPIQNEQMYTKPEVVKEFFQFYNNGLLPKGEIFSIYYEPYKNEAVALYRLFFYAKDFETFYKTAIWARQYVNEYMFVYCFSTALVHRPDTKNVILPPIYEIFPHLFFGNEVIQQAQVYKQLLPQYSVQNSQGFLIQANYSNSYLYPYLEQSKLSYFMEDIGINAFYYYFTIKYPFWMDVSESANPDFIKRPFTYSAVYQQLLAKYYLERYSNGMGKVPFLNFEYSTGFYSTLQYPNGFDFPNRPDGVKLKGPYYGGVSPMNFNYTLSYTIFKDYARRIRDAVDLGYVYDTKGDKVFIDGTNGYQILFNIMQGNPNSPNYRYYGSLTNYARYILGYSYGTPATYNFIPSVLEQPETCLRDPLFYQLYQWIFIYYQRYLNYLPSYTYKDLEMKNVKIQGLEIDRLITFYDYFYTDITNTLYATQKEFNEDYLMVKVRQQRLNHKPFTYRINVEAAQAQEVEVKVFIGPKINKQYNQLYLNEYRQAFVLLDKFDYKLQAGQNTIERNSRQNTLYFPDRTTYKDLYYGVMKSMKQGGKLQYDSGDMHIGLPSRFMLPKGTQNGQTFQLYVYVGQTHPESLLPALYPFDKNAEQSAYFVPNAYLKDVVIYFKEMEELNTTTF